MPGASTSGPRVTVLVNCHNGERTLAETLDCVRRQSFDDWELLLYDDASTDRSIEIFEGYRDPRFRLVRSPSRVSLGAARRAAIRECAGEWIAILDQDDLWSPDKLERQVRIIDEDGGADLGLVYGRTRSFAANGREWEYDDRYEFRPLPEGHIGQDLLRRGGIICMSSTLIRRGAYDAIGGIPQGRYPVAVDYYLYVALALRYRFRALQANCCRYRVHDTSLFARRRVEAYRDCLDVLEAFEASVPPRVLRARRRFYHTLIGLEEALHRRQVLTGSWRILRRGGLKYLLTRPPARVLRAVRRRWHRARSRILPETRA